MADTPGKMYAIAILLTLLAMVAIGLRFYTRHIKKAKYSYDDYMILPAMVSISISHQLCFSLPRKVTFIALHHWHGDLYHCGYSQGRHGTPYRN